MEKIKDYNYECNVEYKFTSVEYMSVEHIEDEWIVNKMNLLFNITQGIICSLIHS